MTTKKSSNKSKKKSGKKQGERKDQKNSGGAKSGGKKAGGKKAGGKKAASRKGAKAAKGAAKSRTMTARAGALIGNCIGSGTAGTIIERAVIAVGGISPSAFDIDKKFEQMGVFTTLQCQQVSQRVLNAVRAFPCTINDGAVTCNVGDKARVMRDAVVANAGKPE